MKTSNSRKVLFYTCITPWSAKKKVLKGYVLCRYTGLTVLKSNQTQVFDLNLKSECIRSYSNNSIFSTLFVLLRDIRYNSMFVGFFVKCLSKKCKVIFYWKKNENSVSNNKSFRYIWQRYITKSKIFNQSIIFTTKTLFRRWMDYPSIRL